MSSRVRVVTPELLDSAVSGLINTSGTASNGAVRTVGAGGGTVQTTGVVAATPNTLVQRDAAGRTQFVSPSVSADAATKGYVDTQDDLLVPKTQLGVASGVATLDGNALVTTAQLPTSLTRSLGSGVSFPPSPRVGDVFLRTDVGTNGSLWTYRGVGGSAGWVADGPIVCTNATRPATAVAYPGLEFVETDTKLDGYHDGTTWWYRPHHWGLTKYIGGTVSQVMNAGSTSASQHVGFPAGLFTSAPNVVISLADTANDYHWTWNADTISNTGMTVRLLFNLPSGGAPVTAGVNACWLAFGN